MTKTTVTLLIASMLLLSSCVSTGTTEDISSLASSISSITTETTQTDTVPEGPVPGAEPPLSPLLMDSVLNPPEGMPPEEVYYAFCEVLSSRDPGYAYPPFGEYMEWLSMETAEEPQDEPPVTVEEITPTVPAEEPEPILDAPQKSTVDKLMDGDAPDSILIMFCILFIATLFTLCYIAKQRKEAAWHRFRD